MNVLHIVVLGFLGSFSVLAVSEPIRFQADALQQDGRITLTPSFTPDGKTIYFSQSECSPIWECPQRLKTSSLGPEGWSSPSFVQLPTEGRVDWPNVSPDGKTLVFSWSAKRSDYKNLNIRENFDLYTLDLEDPAAKPMPIHGADINRPRAGSLATLRYVHNEGYPSLTANGDLYFMTERLDGLGERDIYIAPAGKNGEFQTAHPLPSPINSPQRDDGVWVNPQGSLMLLSYQDRGGQGATDIFIAYRVNNVWQQPINLGPLVNSPFADFGARLTPDGKRIIFTSDRPVAGQNASLLQAWITELPTQFLIANKE